MKTLLNKTTLAIAVLLSIFILGITPCMIVSIFIVIVTDATLQDCIQTVPFILFSTIGVVLSAMYINDIITKE